MRPVGVESAIWIVIRLTLGVFLAVALSIVVWVISQLFLRELALASTGYFITQSLIIGVPAGIGAAAAWWNPEHPASMRLASAVLVPAATFLCAWLTIEIRGVETYYALFGGSQRISVIVLGDMLGALIASSVIGGNAAAAAFYIYRLLRYRET